MQDSKSGNCVNGIIHSEKVAILDAGAQYGKVKCNAFYTFCKVSFPEIYCEMKHYTFLLFSSLNY